MTEKTQQKAYYASAFRPRNGGKRHGVVWEGVVITRRRLGPGDRWHEFYKHCVVWTCVHDHIREKDARRCSQTHLRLMVVLDPTLQRHPIWPDVVMANS